MTFQWAAVATFLYAEIVMLFLLCIPGISPLRWQKIFIFPLWNKIANYWNKAFLAIIILLIVLFLDAIREVRKYSNIHLIEKSSQGSVNPYDHFQMKLFRAQRNLYISGFSLFLWLVLRRIISLTTQLATKTSAHKALEIQVAETNEAARKSLQENEKLKETLKKRKNTENHGTSDETNKKLKQDMEALKTELEKSTNARSVLRTARNPARSRVSTNSQGKKIHLNLSSAGESEMEANQGITRNTEPEFKVLSKTTDEITVLRLEHERLEKEYDNLRDEHKKLQESEKHEKSL